MDRSEKFSLSERKIVKKLYSVLYGTQGQNRYRLDGVPRDEFLKILKGPALKRALDPEVGMQKTEVEEFKKIEFYLDACIEQGYIKKENDRLKLTARGYQLISASHYFGLIGNFVPISIALISLVATGFIAYYTGRQADILKEQIQNSTSQTSAQFVLDMSNRINSSKYAAIMYAIENHTHSYSPLKAGVTTDYQLESYMGEFDTAGDLLRDNIINYQMAYDEFSYDTEKTYCNQDVQTDIARDRKESGVAMGTNAFWSGFQTMAERFLHTDGYTCTSTILDNQ